MCKTYFQRFRAKYKGASYEGPPVTRNLIIRRPWCGAAICTCAPTGPEHQQRLCRAQCYQIIKNPAGKCLKWCALCHSWLSVCINLANRIKPFFIEFSLVLKSGLLIYACKRLAATEFLSPGANCTAYIWARVILINIKNPQLNQMQDEPFETSFDHNFLYSSKYQ